VGKLLIEEANDLYEYSGSSASSDEQTNPFDHNHNKDEHFQGNDGPISPLTSKLEMFEVMESKDNIKKQSEKMSFDICADLVAKELSKMFKQTINRQANHQRR